jgi:intracellular sulfur oxidation DsrE/DsrF family protein
MRRRKFLLMALPLGLAVRPAIAAGKIHRLALQLSDGSVEKMTSVLNVAANVSRYYSGIGDGVEIRIVVFDAGVNMLRTDRSPVLARLKSVSESLPDLAFEACGNTLASMARKENRKIEEIPLFPGTKIVQAGVVELIALGEQGWTIVRP